MQYSDPERPVINSAPHAVTTRGVRPWRLPELVVAPAGETGFFTLRATLRLDEFAWVWRYATVAGQQSISIAELQALLLAYQHSPESLLASVFAYTGPTSSMAATKELDLKDLGFDL